MKGLCGTSTVCRPQTYVKKYHFEVLTDVKIQAIVWDRGRPARQAYPKPQVTLLASAGTWAGGTPAVPDNLLKFSANQMPNRIVKA